MLRPGYLDTGWGVHGSHAPVEKGQRAARQELWNTNGAATRERNSAPDLAILSSATLPHWSELATAENALFAFEPISLIVPMTITRIAASMTAYSAIS